ncbi:hypothetical protein Taro_017235 [Colocasia esculenta]|uniref:Aluminum-activated malate transporter n=1 Tax=Colocasia esculenta TaxID=4460 RepID=A0A843UYS1_COLES|nr:hypothetical protein [Colocasia esculenta]
MEVELGGVQEKTPAAPVQPPAARRFLAAAVGKPKEVVCTWAKNVKKVATDDPRRILHGMKVGLALTLVSLFYYVNPLYEGFGVSAMWAVLTVVVVMEYTVGGTLSKGLNRGCGTLLAGGVGLGAHHLADLCGPKGEPIVLGFLVFVLAAGATFSRFIPEVKARFDYGTMIFILTFSLVAVSSYRVDELLELAQQRLSTIAIGGATCICISLFVFPVWAGGDLHKLSANNLEKLATYLEGLAVEYFGEKEELDGALVKDKSFLQAYKSVLNSKTTEEALANFARWEPAHSKFLFYHPWNQYLKVGTQIRQCAYYIEALTTHIIKSQTPQPSSDVHRRIRNACMEMCSESSKTLNELAAGMRAMTRPSAAHVHMEASGAAANVLKAIVMEGGAVVEILQSASMLSLLTEIVCCTRDIAVAVEELARLAQFKSSDADDDAHRHRSTVRPIAETEGSPHHVINMGGQ